MLKQHIVVLDRLSIPLLKKQKLAVLKSAIPDREKDGLLNLLDYIQDVAEGFYMEPKYRVVKVNNSKQNEYIVQCLSDKNKVIEEIQPYFSKKAADACVKRKILNDQIMSLVNAHDSIMEEDAERISEILEGTIDSLAGD